MIDEILRHNLLIREWVNGGLLPLNVSLVLVIGLFLWTSALEARAWRTTNNGYLTWINIAETWERFQKTGGVQTGCSLFWIFLADAIRAASAWTFLKFGAAYIDLVNAGFIVAGAMAIAAGLRCIYLFTPRRWGHWYWMLSVISTFLFLIIVA